MIRPIGLCVRRLLILSGAVALGACGIGGSDAPDEPNVLLVVLDDVGVWDLGAYGLGEDVPATPIIDRLAASGVLFRNAWSNPLCSPTRATILSGRHCFRTGVGDARTARGYLAPSEVLLPAALPAAYATAAIGKWHVSPLNGDTRAPNRFGFDRFAGINANLISFFEYRYIVDGEREAAGRYATTVQVDHALAWIGATTEPWFCYLAFSAAHSPFEVPPRELYSRAIEPGDDRAVFLAMIEALDTELGRLLSELDPAVRARTVVIVVGDNGTPQQVVAPPLRPSRAKDSVFEGGIRVPLIVAGAGLGGPGAECDALVSTVDLFATVVELAGGAPAPTAVDSVSFAPHAADPTLPSARTHVFAEMFRPDGGETPTTVRRAIRDARYKLQRDDASETLFDLEADPLERVDLSEDPEYAEQRDALRAALDALLASGG